MNKCIVLCGGSSSRFGENKLLFRIEDRFIVEKTVGTVVGTKLFDEVIVVLRKGDEELKCVLSPFDVRFVVGGENRFMSVYNALSVCGDCDVVAIHDGARCFVSQKLISDCVKCAEKFGSGVAAIRAVDTMREIDGDYLGKTLDRNILASVQTPQAFCYKDIKLAYEKAFEKYGEDSPYTDDSAVYDEFIGKCKMVEGDRENIKITYKSDVEKLPLYGTGYDIHKTCDGDGIVLCGVKIPCDKALVAHSDGDVPIHALMDGILSALGKKDIGHYFPDTDEKYKGISSLTLLKRVLDIAKEDGREIKSVSIAIICEGPKLSPFIDEMKKTLSEVIGISTDKVGISVTTNEKVGEIGRGEAIAAICSVVIK